MNLDELSNPLVKAAIAAMRAGDRQGWLRLFAPNAVLTDDGNPRDLEQWSDSELFGASRGYLMSIDRAADDGLTIYGRFHSDQWGEFDTYLKFQIQGDRITRLDVGQA